MLLCAKYFTSVFSYFQELEVELTREKRLRRRAEENLEEERRGRNRDKEQMELERKRMQKKSEALPSAIQQCTLRQHLPAAAAVARVLLCLALLFLAAVAGAVVGPR